MKKQLLFYKESKAPHHPVSSALPAVESDIDCWYSEHTSIPGTWWALSQRSSYAISRNKPGSLSILLLGLFPLSTPVLGSFYGQQCSVKHSQLPLWFGHQKPHILQGKEWSFRSWEVLDACFSVDEHIATLTLQIFMLGIWTALFLENSFASCLLSALQHPCNILLA